MRRSINPARCSGRFSLRSWSQRRDFISHLRSSPFQAYSRWQRFHGYASPFRIQRGTNKETSSNGGQRSLRRCAASRRRFGAFTATSMSGFATFAVMAYHLQTHHIIATPLIPVLYATAMAAAGLSALASGPLYDRVGLRGLVIAPIMAAIVLVLAFSNSPGIALGGSIAWGIATGIHESTMRAAVADLVPIERRGEGYGTFATLYGLAWLFGSVAIGALYDVAPPMTIAFAIGTQIVALVLFIPLLRKREKRHSARHDPLCLASYNCAHARATPLYLIKCHRCARRFTRTREM